MSYVDTGLNGGDARAYVCSGRQRCVGFSNGLPTVDRCLSTGLMGQLCITMLRLWAYFQAMPPGFSALLSGTAAEWHASARGHALWRKLGLRWVSFQTATPCYVATLSTRGITAHRLCSSGRYLVFRRLSLADCPSTFTRMQVWPRTVKLPAGMYWDFTFANATTGGAAAVKGVRDMVTKVRGAIRCKKPNTRFLRRTPTRQATLGSRSQCVPTCHSVLTCAPCQGAQYQAPAVDATPMQLATA